ncbi:MAG: phosphoribosylglycinamide formyltransferase [Fimbriiglobus sp.]|nr:phosphoribosylglycinamide formyltransferase [Fimbriiglobus sp.]
MPPPTLRLAVLLSGSGSTLQNLLDRCADGRLRAVVVGVVSSRADVFGVERARRAGAPVAIAEKTSRSDTAFAAAREWAADLVVCAGWIHLLKVPPDFRGRVLNVHPSLLPKFGGKGMYGRHVHEAVLAAGETESGCTVHLVDDTYDTGPVILQTRVPVLPTDTPDTLAERVQAAEREALPAAIQRLLANPDGAWFLGTNPAERG